jgi:hypothetical protein
VGKKVSTTPEEQKVNIDLGGYVMKTIANLIVMASMFFGQFNGPYTTQSIAAKSTPTATQSPVATATSTATVPGGTDTSTPTTSHRNININTSP